MREQVKKLVMKCIYFVMLFLPSYELMHLQYEIHDGWLSPFACTFVGSAMMGCTFTVCQMLCLCIYWKDIRDKKITADEVLSWRRLL